MVSSVSRRRRQRLPLGKAARAIRAASSGTGSIGSGFKDIPASFCVVEDDPRPASKRRVVLIIAVLSTFALRHHDFASGISNGTAEGNKISCKAYNIRATAREQRFAKQQMLI